MSRQEDNRLTGSLTPQENRELFSSRLQHLSPKDQEFVMYAYDFAKVAHRAVMRQGGSRYFEHPRSVDLILIDECKITDPSILAAGLLHDVAEDTPAFGSAIGKTYDEWVSQTAHRVSKIFNPSVSEIVIAITKPPTILKDVEDEGAALEIYYRNLQSASSNAILVKMADRLHNVRTLGDTPIEKQKRKITETMGVYFPIFEKVLQQYPVEGKYLLDQIKGAIEVLHLS